MSEKGYKISRFAELFSLEILNKAGDYENDLLTVVDVNRPGLQFQGFFDYFDPQRLQVIGKAEFMFLKGLESKDRKRRFDNLFMYGRFSDNTFLANLLFTSFKLRLNQTHHLCLWL